MNKLGKILLTAMFLAFIFGFAILHIVIPDKEVSSSENRTLAKRPDLSVDQIEDGLFMSEFETYYTDHFPSRDRWLSAYVSIQMLTNQSSINDLHILEDDWIMPVISTAGQKKSDMDEAISKIDEFSSFLEKQDIEFYYFALPHKRTTLAFLYPTYFNVNDEKDLNYFFTELEDRDIVAINMVEHFKNQFTEEELKSLYFKTDHHWNMRGAFEGYKIIIKSLEQHSDHFISDGDDLLKESYSLECISANKTFKGSLNRQLYMKVNTSDDDQNMCIMNREPLFSNYEVIADGEKVSAFDLFASHLESQKPDEYTYGNIFTYDKAEIEIINPARKDGANLLVIKNSYTNPLTFHLAQNFYKTVIFDPRHYDEMTLNEYIEQNDFDIVIQMYNNTILSGTNFNWNK